jgi:anti-anti-sigma factor
MLRLSVQNLGDVTIFRCHGRLTAGDEDSLRNAVRSQHGTRIAILDLAEVTAIDAAGLGTLLSLRAWSRAHACHFKLMNLTPWVEEILEITRLKSSFEICSVHDMVDLLCRAADPSQFAFPYDFAVSR